MFEIILKHWIYEKCINILFAGVGKNLFNLYPDGLYLGKKLKSPKIKWISTESKEAWFESAEITACSADYIEFYGLCFYIEPFTRFNEDLFLNNVINKKIKLCISRNQITSISVNN